MTGADREAQIRALLPLVKKIARRISRLVPCDYDDLVGDGSVGLIRAVDNFDPQRGTTLEHYARHLISGAMLNGIRRMDPVPERTRRAMRDAESERYAIAGSTGVMPTLAEMERLRPGFHRVRAATANGVPLSLDRALPQGERIAPDAAQDPARIVTERHERERIGAIVDALPERQRLLVRALLRRSVAARDRPAHDDLAATRLAAPSRSDEEAAPSL
jgi:RNA polymerase sigma factor for flagellar operon FliA